MVSPIDSRDLLSDYREPMARFDPDSGRSGTLLEVNKEFYKVLKYTQDTLAPVSDDVLNTFVHPDDRPYIQKFVDAVTPGKAEMLQFRMMTSDREAVLATAVGFLDLADDGTRQIVLIQVEPKSVMYAGYTTMLSNPDDIRRSIDWAAPYAVVEYTDGDTPRILYMNKVFQEGMGLGAVNLEEWNGERNPLLDILPTDSLMRMTQRAVLSDEFNGHIAYCVGHMRAVNGTGLSLDGRITYTKETGIYRFTGQIIPQGKYTRHTQGIARLVRASANAYAVFAFEEDLTKLHCIYSRKPSELGFFADMLVNLDDGTEYWESIVPEDTSRLIAQRYDKFRAGKPCDDLEELVDFAWDLGAVKLQFRGQYINLGDGRLFFVVHDRDFNPDAPEESGNTLAVPAGALSDVPELLANMGQNAGVQGVASAPAQAAKPNPYEGLPVIRCFGHFEVYANGEPLALRSGSAKELLAILVDRKGGFVSPREAAAALWPDKPVNKTTLARFRKVSMRLSNILADHGIEDILGKEGGSRRVIPEKVNCDFYRYNQGEHDLFKGRYMVEYNWAKPQLAELLFDQKHDEFGE